MRLIRGTPVHRINLGARINHANRSDSPGRLQATLTLGAMLTPVTSASLATAIRWDPRPSRCFFMIVKDLVPLEAPDPSRSSKFCANRNVHRELRGFTRQIRTSA
jgi:hypothetical protein